jgi:ATP synthase protein I
VTPEEDVPRPPEEELADAARRRRDRERQWRTQGEPSMLRFAGQIGVLGWIIVVPILIGLFVGRYLDARLHSGIFWTGPLLLVGVGFGCWSAWRWINKP